MSGFKSHKEQSRRNWGSHDGSNTSTESIQTGCLQRIADGVEAISKGYTDLQEEAARANARSESYRQCNQKLERRIAGLKGQITKLKRRLAK